ncbi:MAG: potassium transporter TrkA [Candidatus Bathyarchaeota archaeon]|nr:potassium transporter TrkA [Candidatus Bathyarchaeota archaeon]
MNKDLRVLIIGLGEIGYSNAEYLAQKGILADGYDINHLTVKRAIDNKIIKQQAANFNGYDYYMVCVSTHNPQNRYVPFFDGILETAQKLATEGKEGALVTIESTISNGISKKICNILNHRLHVAHVPHRYFAPEKDKHGVNQLRVLAGCNSCCTNEAQRFYNELLGIPTHNVSSTEIAELTKVVENTHRFVEIAFAEELKMFCDARGMSFDELREAVNSKWNENVLEAKQGIGGHCLPKDTHMFFELSKQILPYSIVNAAIQSNASYEQYCKKNQNVMAITDKPLKIEAHTRT